MTTISDQIIERSYLYGQSVAKELPSKEVVHFAQNPADMNPVILQHAMTLITANPSLTPEDRTSLASNFQRGFQEQVMAAYDVLAPRGRTRTRKAIKAKKEPVPIDDVITPFWTVRDILRHLVDNLGSVAAVARALEVAHPTVNNWLDGGSPQDKQRAAIYKFIGRPAEWFRHDAAQVIETLRGLLREAGQLLSDSEWTDKADAIESDLSLAAESTGAADS